MEAVSKTGWLADVLLEIAGMSLAAFPQKACRLWSCVFVLLFVFSSLPSLAVGGRKVFVCGKGLGD